jgi:hypothetical protein
VGHRAAINSATAMAYRRPKYLAPGIFIAISNYCRFRLLLTLIPIAP